jgi:hypothetical protein
VRGPENVFSVTGNVAACGEADISPYMSACKRDRREVRIADRILFLGAEFAADVSSAVAGFERVRSGADDEGGKPAGLGFFVQQGSGGSE